MSEEETRPDAPETAAEGSPADVQGEAPHDESQGEGGEGTSEEPKITDSGEHVGLAATILGDTLPSAVRAAIDSHAELTHAAAGAHAVAHDDEHFAHTLPMKMLVGVLGALVILTVLTVAVTSIDLGSQGNFIIAMIIATIKAALVMGYFMHLVWDSKFNVFAFLSSFLFVLLFLSMTLLDRGETQSSIDHFEADQKAIAK